MAGPVAAPPERAGVWVWRRWTRWPLTPGILVVAALAVGVDAVTAWQNVSIGSLGRVAMSPALPLGVLLACRVGLRRLAASGWTAPTSWPGASSSPSAAWS